MLHGANGEDLKINMKNVQREYICENPECGNGMRVCVFHSNMKSRQQQCAWCGQKIKDTGRYWLVWRKNVIGYNGDGTKFEIFKRKDLK
jgi:hypothetical protein